MKEVNVSITKHAKERILERMPEQILIFYTYKAFSQGKKLDENEFKKIFDNIANKAKEGSLDRKKGYFTKEYRKYNGFLWVFGGRGETFESIFYRLITVIPLN